MANLLISVGKSDKREVNRLVKIHSQLNRARARGEDLSQGSLESARGITYRRSPHPSGWVHTSSEMLLPVLQGLTLK